MPEWFRRGWRWLVVPQQCGTCGSALTDQSTRRPFEVFCSDECRAEWDRFADDRY